MYPSLHSNCTPAFSFAEPRALHDSPIMGFSDDETKMAVGHNALATSGQHTEGAPINEFIDHDEIKPKAHFSAIGVQYSLTSAPLAIGFYLSMRCQVRAPTWLHDGLAHQCWMVIHQLSNCSVHRSTD